MSGKHIKWPGNTLWHEGAIRAVLDFDFTMPDAAEITALLMMIRLREMVATIWWLGRGIDSGSVHKEIHRIEFQRAVATWLASNPLYWEKLWQ